MGLSDALNAESTSSRLRFDPHSRTLTGSRCSNCGSVSWPGRAVCQDCGSASIDPASFGPNGEVISYAEVWVPVDGLDSPYMLAQVRIEGGPTVFAHARGLTAGALAPLPVTMVCSDKEAAIPPFWFEAATDEDDQPFNS
jgi:uncharacterized OB-fold protein